MLLTAEWNLDDAKQVWYEEGREEEREKIAGNALLMGLSVEVIHQITGLDIEAIESLPARQ